MVGINPDSHAVLSELHSLADTAGFNKPLDIYTHSKPELMTNPSHCADCVESKSLIFRERREWQVKHDSRFCREMRPMRLKREPLRGNNVRASEVESTFVASPTMLLKLIFNLPNGLSISLRLVLFYAIHSHST